MFVYARVRVRAHVRVYDMLGLAIGLVMRLRCSCVDILKTPISYTNRPGIAVVKKHEARHAAWLWTIEAGMVWKPGKSCYAAKRASKKQVMQPKIKCKQQGLIPESTCS